MRREASLLNENYQTSQEDLATTRLSAQERTFLRDTFQNDPAFYRYLTCPFLLKEIAETGVLASGSLTEKIRWEKKSPSSISSSVHVLRTILHS